DDKFWVTHYVYDERHRLIRTVTQAATDEYTPFSDDGVTPAYVPKSNDGLAYGFEYTDDNRLTATWVRRGSPTASTPDIDAGPALGGVNSDSLISRIE